MIKNPLRYSQGREISYGVTACEFAQVAVRGAVYGLLGARLTRWYSLPVGSAMGICGEIALLFGERVRENIDWTVDSGSGVTIIHVYSQFLPSFAPLLTCMVFRSVNCGTLVKFWVADLLVRLAIWPVGWVLTTAINASWPGEMALKAGIAEWLTRPCNGGPFATLQMSPEGFRAALHCPPLRSVEELTGVSKLENFCDECEELGSKEKAQITAECTKIEENATYPEKLDNPQEAPGWKMCYLLTRNVAAQIDQLPPRERDEPVKRVADALSACETRKIHMLQSLFALLGESAVDKDKPLKQLQCFIRHTNQEIKEELFQEVCWVVGLEGKHSVHLWSRATAACGEELGVVKDELNAEETYFTVHGADWSYRQRLNVVLHASGAEFSGANRAFWVCAIKARYLPRLVIPRQKEAINANCEARCDAIKLLCEHIGTQLHKDSVEAWPTVYACYTEQVLLPGHKTPVAGLNDEGIVLLLKLTGDLVNDGRLSTTKTNAEILSVDESLN
jgi:hypothetical protein